MTLRELLLLISFVLLLVCHTDFCLCLYVCGVYSNASSNVAKWHETFGARVTSRIIAGAKHFNEANEPAVLDEIVQLLQ